MTELLEKVRKKAVLEEQQLELQQEKKRLDKEVFDLKIAAHNEQADVAALEQFSIKGLFLQATGKKEEQLEKERMEARTAKAKYELAAARLANADIQLDQIAQALPELAGCENALSAALAEKLGQSPCPEEEQTVLGLEAALTAGISLQKAGEALQSALDTAMSWLGTQPTTTFVYADEMHQADVQLQSQFGAYLAQLETLSQALEPLGYSVNALPFREFGPNYLRGIYTDIMSINRFTKVQQALVQIGRQWNALAPQLDFQRSRARIVWMNALVEKASFSV